MDAALCVRLVRGIDAALSLCGLCVWVIGLMKMDGVEVSTFSEQ